MTTRTLEIPKISRLGPDGTTEDPKEAAARTSLELGEVYEEAGRLKEAESEYAKALSSTNALVRQQASEALKRVLKRQAEGRARILRWLGAVLEPFARLIVQAVGLFAIVYWVLRPSALRFGRKRGKNKVSVLVADSTQQKLGHGFPDLIKLTRETMAYYFSAGNAIISGNLPALGSGYTVPAFPTVEQVRDTDLAEMLESVVQGPAGSIGRFFNRWLDQPEFTVRASVKSTGQNVNIVAFLETWDKTLRGWDVVSSVSGFLEAERDLAYEVLMELKEYMSRDNAS